MTTTQKILAGVGAVLVVFGLLVGLVLVTQGIGVYNTFVAQEAGLKAQYGQNRNVYDNYIKKVKEVAQIPSMYSEDLTKVFSAAISGRYGKDGSKAVWQFITEHNPNLDPSIYKKVQDVVESGRNEFAANQESLLDKKRNYETLLKSFPNNIYASVFSFPKVDLASIDIVTSDRTETAFQTKKDEALDLRN